MLWYNLQLCVIFIRTCMIFFVSILNESVPFICGTNWYTHDHLNSNFDMSSSTSQNKNGYIGRKIYPKKNISLIKIFNKRYIYKRIYPWRDISAKDILILDIFLNEYFRLKYLFFQKEIYHWLYMV